MSSATNGRIPWLQPDELTSDQRELYDRIAGGPRAQGPQAFALTDDAGRLNGPFNAMLLHPSVGGAMQEMGSAIRYRTAMTGRAREIAILELAVLRKSDFEWFAHERVGRVAGLTDAEMHAIRNDEPVPTFDVMENTVRDVVHTLVTDRDLNDAEYAAALETLGQSMLLDLVALVGYYDMLALSLRVCRTALPRGERSSFGPQTLSPKELVVAFFKNVRSGANLDSVAEYLAPNVIAHQICSEDPMAIERTADEYAGHLREMMEACEDFSLTIDHLLADGDFVYVRWTQRGIYEIPDDDDVTVPTPITEYAGAVYRVDAGKIVEYWIQIDRLGTQRQVQNV